MTNSDLQEHYRHLDNVRLVKIALYEVRDLRREAVDTLRAEIQRRGLPRVLHEAMDLQIRDLTHAEQLGLLNWFRTSACPLCGSTSSFLNACEVSNITGGGFVSAKERHLIAGCPKCLEQELNRASRQAYTRGCLGFPWGLFRAAWAAGDIDNKLEILKTNEPTSELREYVVRCAGAIHAARAGTLKGTLNGRLTDRTV
jgi:hypothetical protein